ncbi:MAG TPA: HAMP domain-containing methyl-accepting chemotaxis protein [Burkholderiaceae bacterium]|nr:HAMP domain-containing methyl-accepting chemotaxis protein [Burkholderiaceae bacterium]
MKLNLNVLRPLGPVGQARDGKHAPAPKGSIGRRLVRMIGVSLVVMFAIVLAVSSKLQGNGLDDVARTSSAALTSAAEEQLALGRAAVQTKVRQTAKMLAQIAPSAIAALDLSALLNFARTTAEDPDVVYVSLRDNEGRQLAQAGDAAKMQRENTIEQEIAYEGTRLGTVTVALTYERLEAEAAKITQAQARNAGLVEAERQRALWSTGAWTAVLLGAALVAVTIILFWVAGSIRGGLSAAIEVADAVAAGDLARHIEVVGDDEITQLMAKLQEMQAGLRTMVEERATTTARIQKENEQLNTSVLGLLQAVAQLSRKDLTVKVPVTEDVTGPVADALNLLTGETATVLRKVSDISADVTQASLKVKSQSDTVMSAAAQERQQVEHTAQALEAASQTMAQIAAMAQHCNGAAERAIKNTEDALATVTTTVGGINSTRDTIRETEKRIKRLGERSQEISVAVNLISSIAERTHILALNAAMHAASAGEAGRGFAVVADEVQRLAENARQATQQIATLVNNIQVETADTVNTMNAAISQVVEGSKLAEQAGRQMQLTQSTTAELVASVQDIARQSQAQARASDELLERAGLIKQSTQETSKQLTEQSEQTSALVAYARNLLEAVRVFKLRST